MARPQKIGVDYFPIDVNFFEDTKIRIIESLYGSNAISVLMRILCNIYSDNGYYMVWDKYQPALFSNLINSTPDTVKGIIDISVEVGFFNEKAYSNFSILTSEGIQKRFLAATCRRTELTLIEDIWFIDKKETKKINPKSIIVYKKYQSKNIDINVDINCDNVDINCAGSELTSTSIPKVEKSRVEKSRVEKSRVDPDGCKDIDIKKDLDISQLDKKEKVKKEKGSTASSQTVRADRPEPFFTDKESDEAFRDLLRYRQSKRIGNSQRAINAILNKLNSVSPERRIAAIDEALEKGWRTVYPKSKDEVSSRASPYPETKTGSVFFDMVLEEGGTL